MRKKVTFSSKDSPRWKDSSRWGWPGFQWGRHIIVGNFHRKNNHFGGNITKVLEDQVESGNKLLNIVSHRSPLTGHIFYSKYTNLKRRLTHPTITVTYRIFDMTNVGYYTIKFKSEEIFPEMKQSGFTFLIPPWVGIWQKLFFNITWH